MKRLVLLSLLFVVTLLGLHQDVRAASLFGKVIEVNGGDTITVFNLNRPVKVRLIGIDAPESGQPFAEVSLQHLKALVLDKLVAVEYSGLGANNSVVGKVTVEGVDICAQMIRDGAAWFDVNNNSRLSDSDREIYRQSEQAARNEKRGIWQSGDAVAPWEFLKRPLGSSNLTSSPQKAPNAKRSNQPTALSSEAILSSALRNASPADPTAALTSSTPREWRHFQPAGANFSVIVPSEGMQTTETKLYLDKPIDFHSYVARDGWTMYAVLWAAGPSLNEPDDVWITTVLSGILRGLGRGYDSVGDGHKFKCDVKSKRDVSQNGFTGQEFDLTGCTKPGFARIYTKVAGGQREFVLGVTFYMQPDPKTQRFLTSFRLGK